LEKRLKEKNMEKLTACKQSNSSSNEILQTMSVGVQTNDIEFVVAATQTD